MKTNATKKSAYSTTTKKSLSEVNETIGEYGFSYARVLPLFRFLNLTLEESAKVTGVSSRTLSRWDRRTAIGTLASERATKIDRLVKKGIDIFGSEESFKGWFNEKNISMNNKSPKELIGEPFGVDLIHDTLLAIEFGNVM